MKKRLELLVIASALVLSGCSFKLKNEDYNYKKEIPAQDYQKIDKQDAAQIYPLLILEFSKKKKDN